MESRVSAEQAGLFAPDVCGVERPRVRLGKLGKDQLSRAGRPPFFRQVTSCAPVVVTRISTEDAGLFGPDCHMSGALPVPESSAASFVTACEVQHKGWAGSLATEEISRGSSLVDNKMVAVRRQNQTSVGPSKDGSGIRLRLRGRLTCKLQEAVSGCNVRLTGDGGIKSSPGVAASWIRHFAAGAGKLVDHQRVCVGDDGNGVDDFIVLSFQGGEICVSLTMYCKLYAYVMYRERTLDLIPSLRSRCIQYGKELGASAEYVALVTPGTISLAMMVMPMEKAGWNAMFSRGLARERERYNGEFGSGEVPRKLSDTGQAYVTWKDRLRRFDVLIAGSRGMLVQGRSLQKTALAK